ncbi:hypothetical protein [Adhaeribacter rhizoryzae]|uniref:Glycosyltransferase RgtA/B/C/D-like domain-containing protein n=1 Tax=Adhaeribacter rhizoryzae TaxID=2607907 RepID=A0A5M6CXW7_9BACT|nr:hypothetical protein [Adhaeribacter rhizoryzae]KAA5539260.1 hypothetical protein F0145_24805 [Adhaeribacter rhizoryzae]
MINKGSILNKSAAFWLPVLLFGLTYLLLGFHYETNDDVIISLLLRGILVQPPLSDLSLYFHGLSHGLTLLYKLAPQIPWYGMLLYALLFTATVLAFIFLQGHGLVRKRFWWAWFFLFFLAGWYEHIFWFNYMRVPLLLTGTCYLLFLSLWGNKNNLFVRIMLGLLFLLALCIRPSAALLGLAVVWPATFLLLPNKVKAWLKWQSLLWFAVIGLGFFVGLHFTQSPAAKEYQRLDWLKSTVIDFEIYEAQPQTDADKLAFKAITQWFIVDKQVINEAYYARAGSINLSYILLKVAPIKLAALITLLLRDHFLVLALNVFLLIFILFNHQRYAGFNRKIIFAYQVYFWLLILAIGIFMKLPPRLITPCLSLYTLVNAAVFLRFNYPAAPKFRASKLIGLIFVLLLGLQLFKIVNRAKWQKTNQENNEAFIATVKNSFPEKIVVTSVLPDYFRSLSPFRNYNFGPKAIFLLTGWQTLDPANQVYFKKLTGQSDFAKAVIALAGRANTVWLMSPEFYNFLQTYFKIFCGQNLTLKPGQNLIEGNAPVQIYWPANLP